MASGKGQPARKAELFTLTLLFNIRCTHTAAHRLWLFKVMGRTVMHKEQGKNRLVGQSDHGSLLVQRIREEKHFSEFNFRIPRRMGIHQCTDRSSDAVRCVSVRKNTKVYAICQVFLAMNFLRILA
jgi:hypothetical protein